MFISIDANTTLNTDIPILYMEDVYDEQKNQLTRITFGGAHVTHDLVTPTLREDVVQMIEDAHRAEAQRRLPQELAHWLDEVPVYPAPTDTPLTQEQLPLEGEDPVDYLNRVTR